MFIKFVYKVKKLRKYFHPPHIPPYICMRLRTCNAESQTKRFQFYRRRQCFGTLYITYFLTLSRPMLSAKFFQAFWALIWLAWAIKYYNITYPGSKHQLTIYSYIHKYGTLHFSGTLFEHCTVCKRPYDKKIKNKNLLSSIPNYNHRVKKIQKQPCFGLIEFNILVLLWFWLYKVCFSEGPSL